MTITCTIVAPAIYRNSRWYTNTFKRYLSTQGVRKNPTRLGHKIVGTNEHEQAIGQTGDPQANRVTTQPKKNQGKVVTSVTFSHSIQVFFFVGWDCCYKKATNRPQETYSQNGFKPDSSQTLYRRQLCPLLGRGRGDTSARPIHPDSACINQHICFPGLVLHIVNIQYSSLPDVPESALNQLSWDDCSPILGINGTNCEQLIRKNGVAVLLQCCAVHKP